MFAVEPLIGVVAAAIVVLVVMAALLTAALLGRGPLYGRFLEIDRPAGRPANDEERPAPSQPTRSRRPGALPSAQPAIRLLVRERRSEARARALARHSRPPDDALDEVLRGSFAVETYSRAVRVLAWSFILISLLVVSVSQLWQPVQPQIFATLILGGMFILVVHELIPPHKMRTARSVMEGTAAIVFLTMLVELTGKSSSPFFFLYALLVGGAAVIASPSITLLLTIETTFAYAVAAFSGPQDPATANDTFARVAINLTALILLAYSGMVVSRVQRRTKEAAIRLSTVDSLTNLYNRAFFFNAVDHEIQRGRRTHRGFCLLMMDLDGLKAINDRYGHYEGDLVLTAVAQIIREGLRGIDVAARYGGDEFVGLLPETDPSGAYVVAEKIRQMVSDLVVDAGANRITSSLSIGVVSYPDDGQTADELMIAADEAMYSSKRLGKNRVVGYAQPEDVAQAAPATHRQQVATPGFRPFSRDGGERDRPSPGGHER